MFDATQKVETFARQPNHRRRGTKTSSSIAKVRNCMVKTAQFDDSPAIGRFAQRQKFWPPATNRQIGKSLTIGSDSTSPSIIGGADSAGILVHLSSFAPWREIFFSRRRGKSHAKAQRFGSFQGFDFRLCSGEYIGEHFSKALQAKSSYFKHVCSYTN